MRAFCVAFSIAILCVSLEALVTQGYSDRSARPGKPERPREDDANNYEGDLATENPSSSTCESPLEYVECRKCDHAKCNIPGAFCSAVCIMGCDCPEGLVLDGNGDCVFLNDFCPSLCPEGMLWNICGSSCANDCDKTCNKMCNPGCYCPEGQIAAEDNPTKCVPIEERCNTVGGVPANQTCPEGMIWTDCGTSCPDSCAEKCDLKCNEGCFCPPGEILDEKDKTKCVPYEQRCGPNVGQPENEYPEDKNVCPEGFYSKCVPCSKEEASSEVLYDGDYFVIKV